MKILIVNRALGTLFGGGESFDYNAARHLTAIGHEVTFLTSRPLLGTARLTYPDVKVHYVASPHLRHFAYATEKINGKLSAIFYNLDTIFFEHVAYRWFAKLPVGTFDVVQCCSLFDLPKKLLVGHRQPVVSWLPGPPSRRVRRRLPSLIANSRFGLFTHGSPEWALQELGFTRGREFEIIEPGIDLPLIDRLSIDHHAQRAKLGLRSNALLGITTARLIPIKNHQLLLNALAKVKQSGIIWHWIFIGDGLLQNKLQQQVQAMGLARQVHFLGHLHQQEVYSWLAIADLFAITSSYENFSIAVLEAMAHRLPIIGTNVGYLKILINEAQAGKTVSPTDSSELAKRLIEFSDAQKRQDYGKSGRQYVTPLNWSLIAKKLDALYKQVIKG